MKEKNNTFALTKQDTAVLKGIAIVAMLMHHLWGCPPYMFKTNDGVLEYIGRLGKVCVSIFLFCSGYGLSVGYSKTISNIESPIHSWKSGIIITLKFLSKRFVKFYSGYWPILLIFVPIGALLFGRSLDAVYGDSHISWALLMDILGIGGWNSYNITWWFNRLIIILYLSFPVIYWCCRYVPWLILPISMGIMLFDYKLPAIGDYEIVFWQCPFILGILWYRWQYKIGELCVCDEKYVWLRRVVFVIVLFVLCYCRLKHIVRPIIGYDFSGLYVDSFITLILAMIIADSKSLFVKRSISLMGQHAANIYMIHTFFYYYWFSSFFYSCELGGGVNLIALLIICTTASIIIEWLKEKTKWNKLSSLLIEKIDKL